MKLSMKSLNCVQQQCVHSSCSTTSWVQTKLLRSSWQIFSKSFCCFEAEASRKKKKIKMCVKVSQQQAAKTNNKKAKRQHMFCGIVAAVAAAAATVGAVSCCMTGHWQLQLQLYGSFTQQANEQAPRGRPTRARHLCACNNVKIKEKNAQWDMYQLL